jgi:hypothetical protein
MWEQILTLALKDGIWATLFVVLLVYSLKDSGKREKKYQETIKDLSTHLGVVKDIKKEVKEIKKYVFNRYLT